MMMVPSVPIPPAAVPIRASPLHATFPQPMQSRYAMSPSHYGRYPMYKYPKPPKAQIPRPLWLKLYVASFITAIVTLTLLCVAAGTTSWSVITFVNYSEYEGLFSVCSSDNSNCVTYSYRNISCASQVSTLSGTTWQQRQNTSQGTVIVSIILEFFCLSMTMYALCRGRYHPPSYFVRISTAVLAGVSLSMLIVCIAIYGDTWNRWINCGQAYCTGYATIVGCSFQFGYSFGLACASGGLILAILVLHLFVIFYSKKALGLDWYFPKQRGPGWYPGMAPAANYSMHAIPATPGHLPQGPPGAMIVSSPRAHMPSPRMPAGPVRRIASQPSLALPSASPRGLGGGGPMVMRPPPEPASEWIWDDSSHMYWSDKQQLYFDPTTGHYFDAASQKWFDPNTHEWYVTDDL